MSSAKQTRGQWGEDTVCNYLLQHEYSIDARNWHCRYGEIDIVARKSGVLVFVEVKLRGSRAMVSGLESVTPSKQIKLRRAAECYLQKLGSDVPARFDVIELVADGSNVKGIEWVKNAF